MSKRRALLGALALPVVYPLGFVLMVLTLAWVLVSEAVPAGVESIIEEWGRE